ncbi:hypothetical protein TWF481_011425 [Arthrobotrys musiformis]|uniref:Uncharacterized protein n=1 Tax=Arthrobotrys musiformis TaxID=47236 RepID=A0AAV9W061_9PEZI
MHPSTLFTATTVALTSLVGVASAHVCLIDAYGNYNHDMRGHAFAIDFSTPRHGADIYPQQRDVTVFSDKVVHDAWHKGYQDFGCGTTLQNTAWWYQKYNLPAWRDTDDWGRIKLFSQITPPLGFINISQHLGHFSWNEWKKNVRTDLKQDGPSKLMYGVPQVTAGGSLNVLAHQINLDGGGAFKCRIDYQANGKQWAHRDLSFQKNCPGDADSLNWPGIGKQCWFTVNMPADLNCQGKQGSTKGLPEICIVRCENSAKNGPFGGCIPVRQIRPNAKPVVQVVNKPVVQVKPVPVTVVKPVKPVVVAAKPVTVTKNNFITIVKDGATKVSLVTKSSVVIVTQVTKEPPQTTLEIQYKTVTVEKPVLVTNTPPPPGDKNKNDAKKPQPKPKPPTKKPTKEEVKAALGGEDYPDDVIEKLQNQDVSDDDTDNVKEISGKPKEIPKEIGAKPESEEIAYY